MHVKDASDIKNRLKIRQDQMEKRGLKCQPLVVICGPTLLEFTHCQVSINGVLYTVPGPLQAVDLAFKSFQVLHAWYPIECEQAWLFIQKEVYKITSRLDKTNSAALIIQLLVLSRNI
ncbi:hypothetical protein FOCC_FOCC012455 [Frankliniella occidentalis]|nr:hypothetical protein FOCC_FOCC012455 [Frankliniella occidentalis]